MRLPVFLLTALTAVSLTTAACSNSPPPLPHPGFDITQSELEGMLDPLPENIRETILENPAGFLDRIGELLDLPEELFVIADKSHDIGPDYAPTDLRNLDDYPLHTSRGDLSLRAIVIPDALAMSEAANHEGVELVFSSTYRSYDYQEVVYNRNVKQLGKARADRESARPGTSQHQLGTVADFGSITDAFADTPAGKWLYENAWMYGFSLSYPDGYESLTGYRHEIWHYRYISRQAAYLERVFFDSVQHHLLYFLAANRDALVSSRGRSRERARKQGL